MLSEDEERYGRVPRAQSSIGLAVQLAAIYEVLNQG